MKYIIAIAVYLLSVWLVWRYMRISHSKGGRWEELNIGVMDLTMVFIPLLNTIFIFLFRRKRRTITELEILITYSK